MRKLSITTLALLFPLFLFAHGAGEAIQKEHNGYLLSVGSADEFVYAGEAGRINFEIENKEGVAFEGWTGVWTRIMSPSGKFLFAGNVERGGDGLIAGMTYYFAEQGTHEVSLRFMNRGEVIAESIFELPVKESRNTEEKNTMILKHAFSILGVLLAGGFVGFWIGRRGK